MPVGGVGVLRPWVFCGKRYDLLFPPAFYVSLVAPEFKRSGSNSKSGVKDSLYNVCALKYTDVRGIPNHLFLLRCRRFPCALQVLPTFGMSRSSYHATECLAKFPPTTSGTVIFNSNVVSICTGFRGTYRWDSRRSLDSV